MVALDLAPCACDAATHVPGSTAPRHTVVVSAHNAARSLAVCVSSLLSKTAGLWELLVVLDGCSDASFDAVRVALTAALSSNSTRGLVRARVIVQPSPVWEASSDNIGMRLAHPNATAIILVQADMELTEHGCNARMEAPLAVWPQDIWAIGGRDAHNVAPGRDEFEGGVAFNKTATQRPDLSVRLGDAQLGSAAGRTVYIRDAVNRGPLLLKADVLRSLGFLNERDFLIRRDEHELMLRGWHTLHVKCGKLDVGWRQQAKELGASRAAGRITHRSPHEWAFNAYRRIRARRAKREAVFVAAGKVTHWNEERLLTVAQIQTAKARAEDDATRMNACDGGLDGQRDRGCCANAPGTTTYNLT